MSEHGTGPLQRMAPPVRAGAYILLMSGIALAVVAGVVVTAVLVAQFEGTLQHLPSLRDLRGR